MYVLSSGKQLLIPLACFGRTMEEGEASGVTVVSNKEVESVMGGDDESHGNLGTNSPKRKRRRLGLPLLRQHQHSDEEAQIGDEPEAQAHWPRPNSCHVTQEVGPASSGPNSNGSIPVCLSLTDHDQALTIPLLQVPSLLFKLILEFILYLMKVYD